MSRTLAVFLFGFIIACGARSSSSDEPTQIVGSWESAPFTTQLGSAVETFCFRRDNTVSVKNATQAGLLENHGTYEFNGSRLVLRWSTGSSAAADVRLREDTLSLKSERGEWRHYKKTERGDC